MCRSHRFGCGVVRCLVRRGVETFVPDTRQALAKVSDAAPEDVNAAVAAPAKTRFGWQGRHLADRVERVRALADLVEANAEELALLDALAVGSTIRNARPVLSVLKIPDRIWGSSPTAFGTASRARPKPTTSIGSSKWLETWKLDSSGSAWHRPLPECSLRGCQASGAGKDEPNEELLSYTEAKFINAMVPGSQGSCGIGLGSFTSSNDDRRASYGCLISRLKSQNLSALLWQTRLLTMRYCHGRPRAFRHTHSRTGRLPVGLIRTWNTRATQRSGGGARHLAPPEFTIPRQEVYGAASIP
jgi:hypothetical protein